MFSSNSFLVLTLTLKYWVNFCIWCKVSVQLHSFAICYICYMPIQLSENNLFKCLRFFVFLWPLHPLQSELCYYYCPETAVTRSLMAKFNVHFSVLSFLKSPLTAVASHPQAFSHPSGFFRSVSAHPTAPGFCFQPYTHYLGNLILFHNFTCHISTDFPQILNSPFISMLFANHISYVWSISSIYTELLQLSKRPTNHPVKWIDISPKNISNSTFPK